MRARVFGGVAALAVSGLSALGLTACGHGAAADPRYPARDKGCDVKVFPEEPDVPSDNIGTVQAHCDDDVSDADCLRTLQDATCRLGGDTVWGVGDKPTKDGAGKNRWYGRAAHTRGAAAAH